VATGSFLNRVQFVGVCQIGNIVHSEPLRQPVLQVVTVPEAGPVQGRRGKVFFGSNLKLQETIMTIAEVNRMSCCPSEES
jgi:hypothetical protein